jgi:outer membrane protein TolC
VVAVANAYFRCWLPGPVARRTREPRQRYPRPQFDQQRLQAGTASALDTAQQESVVTTQRAAIPPLEQTLRQNKVTLAVLMGRSPESVTVRGGSLRSIAYPRVTPGLPSELLAQRPDIRKAEANLAAANANVENARAQFLPSIKLTGEGGYQSAVLKLLLRPESVIYTAAASLTQPIFRGGELARQP